MMPFPIGLFSGLPPLVVVDSNTTGLGNYLTALSGSHSLGAAQSFTGNGKKLARVGFYLNKENNPTALGTCSLYAHTGTYGNSSRPTGAAIATAITTVNPTSITGSVLPYYWDFDETFTLVNSTRYCVGISFLGPGSSYVRVWGGIVSSGNASYTNDGTTWVQHGSGNDCGFIVYSR